MLLRVRSCLVAGWDADCRHVTALTDNATDDRKPTWSPHGKYNTFQSYGDGNYSISVLRADGKGPPVRITLDGNNRAPA